MVGVVRVVGVYPVEATGVVHGPEGFVWAAVRVGRVVASIEAMTTAEDGSSVTTNQQFERIVARMIERAASAQNGIAL